MSAFDNHTPGPEIHGEPAPSDPAVEIARRAIIAQPLTSGIALCPDCKRREGFLCSVFVPHLDWNLGPCGGAGKPAGAS